MKLPDRDLGMFVVNINVLYIHTYIYIYIYIYIYTVKDVVNSFMSIAVFFYSDCQVNWTWIPLQEAG